MPIYYPPFLLYLFCVFSSLWSLVSSVSPCLHLTHDVSGLWSLLCRASFSSSNRIENIKRDCYSPPFSIFDLLFRFYKMAGASFFLLTFSLCLVSSLFLATTATTTTGCVSKNNPSTDCCTGHIEISTSVSAIGTEAFYQCTSLSSVTIPTSVSTIGDYAFYECTSLSLIVIRSSNLTSIGTDAFGSSSDAPCNSGSKTLYVPAALASSMYSAVKYYCTVVVTGKQQQR